MIQQMNVLSVFSLYPYLPKRKALEYTHTLTVKPVKYLILEEQDVTVTVLLLSLRAPPVRMS